jgi:hypothetical protein
MKLQAFLNALETLPRGYSQGQYHERRWGVTLTEATGGRRFKLFAEELGGTDVVSFNLYLTGDGGPQLKPCEMPADKVIDFVVGYQPDDAAATPGAGGQIATCER